MNVSLVAPSLLTAVALAALAWAADRTPPLMVINESPSLPRGLYLRSADGVERGAIVTAKQPPEARLYLGSLGMPSEVALLKRVAARGGERVCAKDGSVWTPTGPVLQLARDSRGATLTPWQGCRPLQPDEVFLVGDTASSFDSRYFGPLKVREVTGVYEEVLTW